MGITPHIEAVRNGLAAVAAVGDAAAAELVQRIASALDASLRLHLLEAVTEAAQELSAQMRSGHVEVRLAGADPVLTYVEEQPEPAAPVGDDMSARITLRLPESLKAGVEAAAAREGVSVNTWLVQAIDQNLRSRPPRVGRRMTGFARS